MSDDQIKPCDPEVFEKGIGVYAGDIPKHQAEFICKGLSEVLEPTGIKIDWHYLGGRVIMRVLIPDAAKQDQNSDSKGEM